MLCRLRILLIPILTWDHKSILSITFWFILLYNRCVNNHVISNVLRSTYDSLTVQLELIYHFWSCTRQKRWRCYIFYFLARWLALLNCRLINFQLNLVIFLMHYRWGHLYWSRYMCLVSITCCTTADWSWFWFAWNIHFLTLYWNYFLYKRLVHFVKFGSNWLRWHSYLRW